VSFSGTTYNATLGSSGLSINALLGGNPLRQLAISALARDSNSRVISNPKVMTRNGENASINVGQEVPTVTSQAVPTGGTPGLGGGSTNTVPQTVQYRNTGVLLRVRPVVHASDRIDLEVNQEVSSAEPTLTGVTTSPTIRKRSIETKLTARDGETILLGGLISDDVSDSNVGVPGAKDVPFFGRAFRSDRVARDRTELVVMITPYIMNDPSEASAATAAFVETLGPWAEQVRSRLRQQRAVRAGADVAPAAATVPRSADVPAVAAPTPPVSAAPNGARAPAPPPAQLAAPALGTASSAAPVAPAAKPASAVGSPAVAPAAPAPTSAASAPRSAASTPVGRFIGGGQAARPIAAQAPAAASASAPRASASAAVATPGARPASAPGRVPTRDSLGPYENLVPQGATVVDDPELIKELLRGSGKK
jgi:general secretion pathway protein D